MFEYTAAFGLAMVMFAPRSCAPHTSGAPRYWRPYRAASDQTSISCRAWMASTISVPSDRRKLPAWLVAAGVQLATSSWSDQRISIGSSVELPISLAPKQNAKRNMSDTNAKFVMVGTSDAPPKELTYTPRVPTPELASQYSGTPPRWAKNKSSPKLD